MLPTHPLTHPQLRLGSELTFLGRASQPLTLNLKNASQLAHYALLEAEEAGIPVVFSLVDAAGHQRYFFSMDNALLVSHRLAFQKAYTAAALKMPTCELTDLTQPGAELYGLQHQTGLCCIGGGVPYWHDGQLLGAIGISGGSVAQDVMIAEKALQRFAAAQDFPLSAAVQDSQLDNTL